VAFGVLATRTAESVAKGDRVVVTADDLTAEAWASRDTGEPRARITLRARDIAASMTFDSLRTGYAARKAARAAAADGEPNNLPAHEQAEARVLSGVTTTAIMVGNTWPGMGMTAIENPRRGERALRAVAVQACPPAQSMVFHVIQPYRKKAAKIAQKGGPRNERARGG
jgi:single-stranded DNA-binding protein